MYEGWLKCAASTNSVCFMVLYLNFTFRADVAGVGQRSQIGDGWLAWPGAGNLWGFGSVSRSCPVIPTQRKPCSEL